MLEQHGGSAVHFRGEALTFKVVFCVSQFTADIFLCLTDHCEIYYSSCEHFIAWVVLRGPSPRPLGFRVLGPFLSLSVVIYIIYSEGLCG